MTLDQWFLLVIAVFMAGYGLFALYRGIEEKFWFEKAYFKRKLWGVDKAILDLKFRVRETRQIREGVRKSYDDEKETLAFNELQRTTIERYGMEIAEKIKPQGPEFADKALSDEGYEVVSKATDTPVEKLRNYQLTEEDRKVIKSLENAHERYKETVDKLKAQLDGLDQQIKDPVNGITAQMEALISLKDLVKEHIKSL